MKWKKLTALAMASMMIATILSGCGGGNSEEKSSGKTAESSSEAKPDEKQELVLNNVDCKVLDVNDARNANEFVLLSHVQEGLFRVFSDKDGNDVLENAGCESYEVSDDGLTYTFKLRDYKWSDGQPVTAQHYVDSIKRLLNPENGFSYSFMAYDIENAEAYYDGQASADDIGVKALDDKTLEIKLRANIPFFIKKLTNVCFDPVRLDVIEKAGDQTKYNADYKLHVFCGPFVIADHTKGNEIVLEKNPEYWDAENVHLEKVTLKEIPEDSTKSILIENKELDAVEANSEYIAKWQKLTESGQLANISKTSPSCNYMCFNQHTGGLSGLMNNAKCRKALSLAINREEMNEVVYSGINIPAYGLIPAGMLVGEEEFRTVTGEEPLKADYDKYKDDNEGLQKMFKEGMKEAGVDKDLKDVELTIISSGTTVQDQAIQEYFKQTWEDRLGVKVNVNICADTSLFVDERNNNRYDLVFMGWNGDYNDPMTFMELFNTGSGYAKFMGGYSNEEFDKMFDSLAEESDMEKRAETYVAMENNLINEQAGIAPIFYSNKQFFVQSYVKDMSFPTFGSAYEFSRAYISGK